MWSDQRLISHDSEEEEDHSPELSRSELTRVLRCVGATETLPGRSGERKERRGMRRPLPVPPTETPPGAGRLPEVGSGNFLSEAQKTESPLTRFIDDIDLRIVEEIDQNYGGLVTVQFSLSNCPKPFEEQSHYPSHLL